MDLNARTWAMLLHLSVFTGYLVPIAGLLAPILIWQLKKAEFPELDEHGKIVMNFLISMLIYSFIAFVLSFVLIGFLIAAVLVVVGVAFPIIGGLKANSGEVWHYPLMLNLIK